MNTLQDLRQELQKVARQIEDIQSAAHYDEYGDLSGLDVNTQDSESLFLWDELRGIMDRLDRARGDIEYLALPIAETGRLRRNSRDRYELPSGYEFTSGSGIEVLLSDDWHDVPYWSAGRIEHNGTDYYFTGARDLPLNGAKARRRGRE